MNDSLTQLSELLRKLPGIGPRQARRLAFWFVRQNSSWVESFANALTNARKSIQMCSLCMRLFPKSATVHICAICSSEARDSETLLLVEKDVDLENIEKTGAYSGRYFVLGGTTSPLDKEPERKIRVRELITLLSRAEYKISEIIYALSATTEGEDTVMYLEDALKKVIQSKSITVTKLGRGLSTGTELEYVDKDTMNHALKGRG